MSSHVMSMTYLPKIPAVLSGECTQTIRTKGKKQKCAGDIITLHGWSGKAYRSKWSWRKRVVVYEVIDIQISSVGMRIDGNLHAWTSWYPGRLAEYDFIDPPTGEGLRDVLFGLNGAPDGPEEYQIIRWTQ